MMNLLNRKAGTALLQQIARAKLLRVFYYTQYSLLIEGQDRLARYCFFTEQATAALDEAREVMRALVLLDATEGCSIAYPTVDLGAMSYREMLRQALIDEQAVLDLCCLLYGQVESKPSYFLSLAEELIRQSRQNISGMRGRLLADVEQSMRVQSVPHWVQQLGQAPSSTGQQAQSQAVA